jgi:hypothetical protein
MDIVKLMADPAELQSRIRGFEEAKAQADASIALVGKAREIPALHAKAAEDVESARVMLESAKEEAADILARAKNTARANVDKSNKKAEDIVAIAQMRMEEAEKLKADLATSIKELSVRRAEFDAAKDAFDGEQVQAAAASAIAAEELSKRTEDAQVTMLSAESFLNEVEAAAKRYGLR